LKEKSSLNQFWTVFKLTLDYGPPLQVYEHGLNTVKIPKTFLNGSTMLMMGFPDCGSSYFLLMQLDKDFKPLFKMLETQPDPSGKDNLFGDLNQVLRFKKIDIAQMQVLEDEMNLSLVDLEKLHSILPNAAACPNQTSGHDLYSDIRLENSIHIARGHHPSGFSSLVDEVFGLEKGSSAPPFPVQNLSSPLNTSLPSHYGSVPMNVNVTTHYNGSLFSSGSVKGPVQSSSVGSIPNGQGRGVGKKLSSSKSEQDLASVKSPHSVDISSSTAMDEDTANDALSGSRSSLLSPPRLTSSRMSAPSSRPNGPPVESFKTAASTSCATTPVCKILSLCLHLYCVFYYDDHLYCVEYIYYTITFFYLSLNHI
jgi:mediator of RNA polymerase II transcription subunit 14